MNRTEERKTIRYREGKYEIFEDTIAIEYPVTIRLNGEELATIVCTPEFIEDMVVGFLASERVILKYEDIEDIQVDEKTGFVNVRTSRVMPMFEKLQNKRYITSCCGMSRQGFVFANDVLTARTMAEIQVTLTPKQCFDLMSEMHQSADLFHATGGVHNAAICHPDGMVLSRVDIGRHNALDKIYGHCLRNNISVQDKVVVFSGRISSEILLKVAKIGCEIILSKSAPTELALQLAGDLGITTVGFIRGSSFNLYTHPERIIGT